MPSVLSFSLPGRVPGLQEAARWTIRPSDGVGARTPHAREGAAPSEPSTMPIRPSAEVHSPLRRRRAILGITALPIRSGSQTLIPLGQLHVAGAAEAAVATPRVPRVNEVRLHGVPLIVLATATATTGVTL